MHRAPESVGSFTTSVNSSRRAKIEALVETVPLQGRTIHKEGDPLTVALSQIEKRNVAALWHRYPEGFLQARSALKRMREEDVWLVNQRSEVRADEEPHTGELVVGVVGA